MAGRKRGSVLKIASAKHTVRGLIVPQGPLQRRSRYVLAGGSAVVGLLLGVWAVTALHRLHTRVRMDATVIGVAVCALFITRVILCCIPSSQDVQWIDTTTPFV